MAEGLARLVVAEGLAEGSERLAEEGAADFVAGLNELEEAQALDAVAKDVATEGVAEIAAGSAAIGAMAENESLFGIGLILTVIPETIVIFGLVVALLIS